MSDDIRTQLRKKISELKLKPSERNDLRLVLVFLAVQAVRSEAAGVEQKPDFISSAACGMLEGLRLMAMSTADSAIETAYALLISAERLSQSKEFFLVWALKGIAQALESASQETKESVRLAFWEEGALGVGLLYKHLMVDSRRPSQYQDLSL